VMVGGAVEFVPPPLLPPLLLLDPPHP